LIDSPQSKWLGLTEEEKEVVEERTRDNAVVRKRKVNQLQYWEAIKEPRLWLIFVMVLLNNLQNGGLILFGNVLVTTLGFDKYQAIILQIPSGAMSSLCVLGAVYLQRKTKQLVYSAIIMTAISMIGCLLLAVLPQTGVKLLGFYLTWPCTGAYTLMVTLVAGTVSGYSKKIFYNGAVMVAYTLGNFIGPLMIVDHEAPAYKSAMWGYFASNVVIIICFVVLRIWLTKVNKNKAPGRTNTPTDVSLNLTDREDPNWVYHM
jgi:hypothetical protein